MKLLGAQVIRAAKEIHVWYIGKLELSLSGPLRETLHGLEHGFQLLKKFKNKLH